jgi:hypothetical protein
VVGRDLDDVPLIVGRMHDAVRRARQAGRPRGWMRRADPGRLCGSSGTRASCSRPQHSAGVTLDRLGPGRTCGPRRPTWAR